MRTAACLPREAEIVVIDCVIPDEFLKDLELVLLPIGIVNIFIEQHNGAWYDAVGEQHENGARRPIEIAVDVNERNGSPICIEPLRDAGCEPAAMQPDIARHSRQAAAGVKGPPTKVIAAHSSGSPSKLSKP
jgi:hypothetical protein